MIRLCRFPFQSYTASVSNPHIRAHVQLLLCSLCLLTSPSGTSEAARAGCRRADCPLAPSPHLCSRRWMLVSLHKQNEIDFDIAECSGWSDPLIMATDNSVATITTGPTGTSTNKPSPLSVSHFISMLPSCERTQGRGLWSWGPEMCWPVWQSRIATSLQLSLHLTVR